MPPVDALLVAVPARDEEATIEACLGSIAAAALSIDPGIPVEVVLAADGCSDRTAALAQQARFAFGHLRLTVVSGDWGSAGAARAAATAIGLRTLRSLGFSNRTIWIAGTDADTTVPAQWLTSQVLLAADGADLVLGTVALPETAPVRLAHRFRLAYQWPQGEPHPHVHGANFGIRASAYETLGGWPIALSVGEDHDLLTRAVAAELTIVKCTELEVVTSDRVQSRVSGGFAGDLAALQTG